MFGTEGCCKTIVSTTELDLYDVFQEYQISGEIASVEFEKLIDFNSFEIKIYDIPYLVEINSQKSANIKKSKNGL